MKGCKPFIFYTSIGTLNPIDRQTLPDIVWHNDNSVTKL